MSQAIHLREEATMKKICEYKLLQDKCICRMNKRVNEYIKEGWQPYGSPCCTQASQFVIVQAVVKYEKIEK